MGEFNQSKATTTDFTNIVPDFIVTSKALDVANEGAKGEFYHYFEKATQNYGYYKSIPEIFSAANSLSTWTTGRGSTMEDKKMQAQLEHIKGMGRDSFHKIMWNHQVVKVVVGDSFAEVKKNKSGLILNIIPISPERVRIVFNNDGMIKRYDAWNGEDWRAIQMENMLHSSNKRIGDEVHGQSQIEPAKFIIDARNEALADERVIKHRDKALGIVRYKTNNAGKITFVNSQVEKAVKNGEMLGIPEDSATIEPWPSRSSEDRTTWITYLENFFYQVFGVPRSIATSDGTSEVGGKMGHVIFEPVYVKEQKDLEDDLLTQHSIKILFTRPPKLGGLQEDTEEKNTGQTRIQPNDVEASLTRE